MVFFFVTNREMERERESCFNLLEPVEETMKNEETEEAYKWKIIINKVKWIILCYGSPDALFFWVL